ncbi:alpha/beta fold hydrolase [bacterium]|nr:alpha/beta fold hydrolase [bacterium]
MKLISSFLLFLFLSSCSDLFFYPDRHFYGSPSELGIPYQEFSVKDKGEPSLTGWFLPGEGNEELPTIFYLHGNAQNISAHLPNVAWLPAAGFPVVLVDPRGYGGSEGEAEIEGVHEDVRRTLRFLRERSEQFGDEYILVGQSLGATLALRIAAEKEFADLFQAIVVESPFASYRAIAREKVSDFWLLAPFQHLLVLGIRDDYSPERYIHQLPKVPLLFLIAEHDAIVPPSHTESLFRDAREPKWLWRFSGKGHLQIMKEEKHREKVRRFLRAVLQGHQSRGGKKL